MGTYPEAAAAWLAEAMRQRWKGSNEDLGEAAGVGRATVYDILRGKGSPRQGKLNAIAATLGIDPPIFRADPVKRDVKGWLGAARNALEEAERLLESEPSAGSLSALAEVGDPSTRELLERAGELPSRPAPKRRTGNHRD